MKKILLGVSLLAASFGLQAQWSVTNTGSTGDTITFDQSFTGVNSGVFAGTGFTGTPAAGQLNSNAWKFLGFSDGNTTFGGSFTTGDYAKGPSAGGIFSGGLYSFEVASGDSAVGIQPTGSDWTPGSMILRAINNTGGSVDSFTIAYDAYVLNNGDRGNSFNFSYSINDSTSFTPVNALNDTSVEVTAASPAWVMSHKEITIFAPMSAGDVLYLVWEGSDALGGGSRDEFALDNIALELLLGTPPPAVVPTYDIATITTNDANGEADSLGVFCWTTGVVMGIDLDGNNGYTFTLWDNEGIAVRSFNDIGTYSVAEGDSLLLRGTVGQFNGLTQFLPDSLVLLNQGNTIPTPTVVTSLSEATESELIRLDNFYVIDNPSNSGSFNTTLSNGTDTVTMRVDSDTDIEGNVTFNFGDTVCFIIGIGGQFDNSSPYDEGYQILPQRASDVDNNCGSLPPPPEPVIPILPIKDINNVDANGEPDSLGRTFWTSGMVLGINVRPSGLQFTIFDEEGIGVFSFNGVSNYTVAEGDSIMIRGEVAFFNGLTQLNPDSIMVINSGNPLPAPSIVTTLVESNESTPVQVFDVMVIDPNDWSTTGSFNIELLTCSGDTIAMRVDSDTEIADTLTSAPSGMFSVKGIVGQFDNSSPYDEGYQIFPMSILDFDTTGSWGAPSFFVNEVMTDNINVLADANGEYDDWVELYNPGASDIQLGGVYFSNDSANALNYMVPANSAAVIPAGGYALVWCDNQSAQGDLHTSFELDSAGAYFSATFSDGCNTEAIDAMVIPALSGDASYGRSEDGGDSLMTFPLWGSTPNAMNLIDATNSIGEIDEEANELIVYPNPSNGNATVRFNQTITFDVYDVLGSRVSSARNTNELNVAALTSGVYFIQTSTNEVIRMVVK